MDFVFLFTNLALGAGLAMDAFSVSLANGLTEPNMKKRRMTMMALIFALFQAAMPLIGWLLVHTFVHYFTAFEPFIPWIALVLLLYIGGKMLHDGLHPCKEGDLECVLKKKVSFPALLLQGIATSIDALSVGFTIAEYDLLRALGAAAIIAIVTFAICFFGIYLGKHFGTKLSGRASILGGVILIFIGLEIFISSFF